MSKIKKINKDIIAICILVVVLCVGILVWKITDKSSQSTTSGDGQNSTIYSTDSSVQGVDMLDASLTYYADIAIKNYGTITIKLEQDDAPITCANFVKLANDKFYDGLTFHRIIERFMMQGGDPNGNGTGGSPNNIVGEFASNGYNNQLSHTRGAISMARSGDPNSASSQFFIVHEDSTYLDGDYAVFGYVTEGIDVVDKVCQEAKAIDNNGTILSTNQPIITSISIRTE